WEAHTAVAVPERDRLVQRVTDLAGDGLREDTPAGPRLAAAVSLAGDDMIRFLTEVAPRLVGVDGVTVDLDDAGPVYREACDAPVISFIDASDGTSEQTDWFDLSVEVTVGDERVGFTELFTGLAEGSRYLILPSGTYFS